MSDRIALITGGTRGIGRAISLRFARGGITPVMLYRSDEAAAKEALEEVRAHEPRAAIHRVDVSSEAEVAAHVAEIHAAFGRIDVLVNNAFRGGRPAKKLHEIDPAAWNEDLATNLTGPFLVTRAVLPLMIAAKHGRIVFIGSLAARGERGRGAYVVAKNGLIGLSRTVAQEYARDGITSNVVSPGYIAAGGFLRLDDAIQAAAIRRVPVGRPGTGEEVAEAVFYLASPGAAYVTGQVLAVDGGSS
jgi:3-oxoacyl-[acyl-carrier protein] reductase